MYDCHYYNYWRMLACMHACIVGQAWEDSVRKLLANSAISLLLTIIFCLSNKLSSLCSVVSTALQYRSLFLKCNFSFIICFPNYELYQLLLVYSKAFLSPLQFQQLVKLCSSLFSSISLYPYMDMWLSKLKNAYKKTFME